VKPIVVLALVLIASGVGALVSVREPSATDGTAIPAARSAPATPATTGAVGSPKDPQPSSAELDAARARIAELEETVRQLRVALEAAESARIEREREFLRFTQGISQLGTLAGGTAPTFATQVPAVDTAAQPAAVPGPAVTSDTSSPAAETATAAAQAPDAPAAAPIVDEGRSRAIYLNLRALLAAEQVQGIDLLESGNLQQGFVGPIVMRELDGFGHPIGSLVADRLRLEASRAARMVTIVLEQGCERRDGAAVPFAGGPADEQGRGGQRRIVLSDCNPRTWIESMPELFPPKALDDSIDDGKVDLAKLRATLNTLLHGEAGASVESAARPHTSGDWYRVQGIGGVQGSVLRDVALDQFDRDGRLLRRLFADRMAFLRETHGLQILLQDGTQVRGEEKAPFLEGRYRIFLPRADADAWGKEGVPGLGAEAAISAAPVAPASPSSSSSGSSSASTPPAPKPAPDPNAPPAPGPTETHPH
jgi:hypothetical protein